MRRLFWLAVATMLPLMHNACGTAFETQVASNTSSTAPTGGGATGTVSCGPYSSDGPPSLCLGTATLLRQFDGPSAEAMDSFFGASVASGADFNSDGVQDILIGSPRHSANDGKVQIYSGSTGALLQTVAAPEVGGFFGEEIAAGQDWDTDGQADFIASGRLNTMLFGAAVDSVRYYFSGSSFTQVGALTRGLGGTGVASGNGIYYFVGFAYAGDISGDGKRDYVMSMPFRTSPSSVNAAGAVYTFNSVTGLPIGSTYYGTTSSAYQGRGISSAGDADADGFDDTLIGSPGVNEAQIYSAKTATKIQTFVPPTTAPTGNYGMSVASGDFNADGKTDFAVSAPDHISTTPGLLQGNGRVYVYSGADYKLKVVLEGRRDNAYLGCDLAKTTVAGKDLLVIGSHGCAGLYSQHQGFVYVYKLGW